VRTGCFNNHLQAFRKMPMNKASKHNSNHKIDEKPPPQPPVTVAVAPSLNMQTPARPVNIGRRVTHTADAPGNPHVTTPLDETKSQKKKRQNRIRAFNSRYHSQSELWCTFRLFLNQISFSFHFFAYHYTILLCRCHERL
jgi:hypothetical protein